MQFQLHSRLAQCTVQQHPTKLLPGRHWNLIDACDQFARRNLRLRGRGARQRFADYWSHTGHAMQEQNPVEQDGEQKISYWSRKHDDETLRHRLPIERAVQFFARDRAFTFIQHLDVAAERERRYRPLRLVCSKFAPPQYASESQRETQYLDLA